jgi:hypothetical protein
MRYVIENDIGYFVPETDKDVKYLENLCSICGLSPCDCEGTCDGCGRTHKQCNQDDAC